MKRNLSDQQRKLDAMEVLLDHEVREHQSFFSHPAGVDVKHCGGGSGRRTAIARDM
jgi:hypothetical protein